MAVIEVDGGDHDRPEQKEIDSIKNCILEKSKPAFTPIENNRQ